MDKICFFSGNANLEEKNVSRRCKILPNGDSVFAINESDARFSVDQVIRVLVLVKVYSLI